MKRDDHHCRVCGNEIGISKHDAEVHHIIPEANGGKNALENLITLCRTCHADIHKNRDGNEHLRYTGKRNPENRSIYRRQLVNVYIKSGDYQTLADNKPKEFGTVPQFMADVLRKKAEFLRQTVGAGGAPIVPQHERP